MKTHKGYSSEKLSINRRMVIASISQSKKSGIHCVTEMNVTQPRSMIRRVKDQSGLKISFTAYLTKCLAATLEKHPDLNSFIKGRRIIYLKDITISVLVEREVDGERFPEPVGIEAAQEKKLIEIHDQIRAAQKINTKRMGDLADAAWIRFIPLFLMKSFIKLADRNVKMAKKYGKVAITAVGMFSKSATWFIPHGSATVLLTVGSISKKPVEGKEGMEWDEYLHLTATFDHEIVDGSPAARFMQDFAQMVESGEALNELL